MPMMNWPRNGWGVPSWDILVWLVSLMAHCFGFLDLVILWGKNFLYQLKGIVFACTPGSIFMVRALGPCFIVIWSMVKKAVWPSVTLSVSRVPALGIVEAMLFECRGCAGWFQCYLSCICMAWNCICFSVVICGSIGLRGFCLNYGRTVYFAWGIALLLPAAQSGAHLLACLGLCPCCPGEIVPCYCNWLGVVSGDSCRGLV